MRLIAILLALVISAPAQMPARRVVLTTGKSPGPIAIGDLNRDGHPDIVVGNLDDGSVSVFLGDGNGHFAAAPGSPFPCNPNPNDIAIADFNDDGIPDLLIANTQTPNLTLLLGDGHGGFRPAPRSPFATASNPHPHGVAVGDFTDDGHPAVVTDSWGNDRIFLIPTDGSGTLLVPGTSFPANLHSDSGVVAADFNHDGHLDIVTANQRTGTIGLLLGDGRGGFRPAPGGSFPAGKEAWYFAVGDLNGDGNPDVAVVPYQPELSDSSQLTLRVLFGDGRGGLAPRKGPPLKLSGCTGPHRVAIGDLDHDGFADIAVACAENNTVLIFHGARDGVFRRTSLSVPTGWGGLAIGRLLDDARNGLVIANNSAGTVTLLLPSSAHARVKNQ